MTIGVHSFEIPHDHVSPTRDMVIIRIPSPPKTVGDKVKFIVPAMSRELAQHNVLYGLIKAMGPIAFGYKAVDGWHRQDAEVGDWVIIRPFAGTLIAGGKLVSTFGWRYVSSFQDVIGIVKADKMPPVDGFLWDDGMPDDDTAAPDLTGGVKDALPAPDALPEGVRERVTYASEKTK